MTEIPLPRRVRQVLQTDSISPGLFFERFADSWNAGKALEPGAKKEFLGRLVLQFRAAKAMGEPLLEAALARRTLLLQALVGRGWPAQTWTMKGDWRFTTGLGNAHPYESGFLFHRTLGVPYLPGSGVKGAARAWAEREHPDDVVRVFGSESDPDATRIERGHVIFFDALPTRWPTLEIDLLNPHVAPYYQGKDWPADWHDPVLVYFPVLAAGQTFEFAVAAAPEHEAAVNLAKQAIVGAGQEDGFGAKSAVGYGYFSPVEK